MKLKNLTGFELTRMPGQVTPPTRSLTLIVKGTFDIVPDGVCTPAAKQRPVEADRTFLDDVGEIGRASCRERVLTDV